MRLLQELNLKNAGKIEDNCKNTEELLRKNQKNDNFKEVCIKKVEDCLGFYVRQLNKAEEKMNRLELCLELLKKEMKMIKSVIFVNYKKDLSEKNEEIKENKDNLVKVLGENLDLKGKITELIRDVQFYKEEIKKQREIVYEITEETEFERKTLASINKIKGGELFVFEKDEFFSEMMEKVPEMCEKCETIIQELENKNQKIEQLEGQVNKLKSENEKLVEDNENLELITGKMQDIIISSENKSQEFRLGGSILSPKGSGEFNRLRSRDRLNSSLQLFRVKI